MFCVPTKLKHFVKLCGDSTNYALGGVFLEKFCGSYRANFSDGKAGAVITGPSDEPPPSMIPVDDAAPAAIIPPPELKAACDAADKTRGPKKIGVTLGANHVSMANCDGATSTTRQLEGRYPPLASVIEDARKSRKVAASFLVDPVRLTTVAKALSMVADKGDACQEVRVEVLDKGDGCPLLAFKCSSGPDTIEAVLFCLIPPKPKGAK